MEESPAWNAWPWPLPAFLAYPVNYPIDEKRESWPGKPPDADVMDSGYGSM